MFTLRHAGLSDRGRVRTQNEDRWFADPQRGLFLVADGMGGRSAGAVAAEFVVQTLPDLLDQRLQGIGHLTQPAATELFQAALQELNSRLMQKGTELPDGKGMGSTVVLALIREGQAWISHLGDSRAYLLRSARLERLTRDHTLTQQLLDNGEITPEQAAEHPGRRLLTRHLGIEGDFRADVCVVPLQPGDRLLLCSDGLNGSVAEEEILNILQRQSSLRIACTCLIGAANAAGGKDNITALLISVG